MGEGPTVVRRSGAAALAALATVAPGGSSVLAASRQLRPARSGGWARDYNGTWECKNRLALGGLLWEWSILELGE